MNSCDSEWLRARQYVATLIAELDLKPVIISESPILDVDAQKMRDIVLRALESEKRP